MKCKKRLLILSALSALTLIVSSCTVSKQDDDPDEPVHPTDVYYRVEFQNFDGAFLYSDYVLEDTYTLSSLYKGPDPTKNEDETYSYTFDGWNYNSVECSSLHIDKDVTFVARYSKSPIVYYHVQFVNYDGTLLYDVDVKKGSDAVYEGPLPTRPDDNYGNTFTFLDWSGSLTNIQSDSIFVANYSSTKRKQTVRFLNYDSSILDIQQVYYGDTVTYAGEKPTRPDEGRYSYTFSGWDKPLTNIIEDTDFHAEYSTSDRQLTVTFVNYDGSLLYECHVYYGETAMYSGATPTRPPEGRYEYVFSDWSGSLENITGNIELRALFDKVDRSATNGLQFSYDQNNEEYYVTGYTGTSKDVFVPKMYNGYYGEHKVTTISEYAFRNKAISSIFLEDNIYSIGSYAFESCYQLVNVRLPNLLRSLGDYVFSNCSNIASLTLPSTVDSINRLTFSNFNNYLAAIKISSKNPYFSYEDGILYNRDKSVLYFPANPSAFSSKRSYTVIDGVKRIDSNAFREFYELRSVTLPDSLEEIGDYAFYYCSNIASINMPESVEKIGKNAFYYCSSLAGELTFYSAREIDSCAFYYSGLTRITFSGCPCVIMDSAFSNSKVQEVDFGSYIKELRNSCFANCSKLTTVDLPASVEMIATDAFYGCNNLKSVNVASDNKNYCSIDGVLFTKDMSALIIYPSKHGKIMHIDADFVGDIYVNLWRSFNVESFEVDPDNTKYCSVDGVIYSKNMSELIVVPNGLTSFVAPSEITNIRSDAFQNSNNLKTVDLSNSSITALSEYAFAYCYQLEDVILPNGLESIGNCAFYNCTSLTSITLPSTMTSIYSQVFCSCSNLKTVELNEGLNFIDSYVFAYCSNLENIVIPSTVETMHNSVFYYCSKIQSMNLSMVRNLYSSEFFRDCTSLTSVTLPSTLSSIDSYMFYNCTSLVDVELPSSTINLGYMSFYNCASLTSLDVSHITWTDNYVFYGCSSLEEIEFSDSVNLNCSNMFNGCASLVRVKLPSSLGYIGEYMFCGCSSLTTVNISNVSYIYSHAFEGCSSLQSITMPVNLYELGSHVFKDCTSLTSITIHGMMLNSISSDYMFYNCTSLAIVDFQCNLTYIGSNMFYNCSSLVSFTHYGTIEWVSEQAFYGCKSLNNYFVQAGVTYNSMCFANIGSVVLGTNLEAYNIPNNIFYGTTIYFEGSKADWNTFFNPYLTQHGTVYFLSEEEPEEAGNYWHYVNGQPSIWVIENNQ